MLPCGTYPTNYEEDMAIVRTRLQWGLLGAGLVFLFCLPLFAGLHWLGFVNMTMIYIVAVLGLNILTGYCGQVSVGQAAFMGVGAYTSAILVAKLHLSFLIALPCAGIMTGLVGLIVGIPSLRVKGFYLLLATLAAQFIIMWVAIRLPHLTGGYAGLVVSRPKILGFSFETEQSYFYIIAIVMIIMTFFAKNIVRTRAGRAFVAIRDNDLAAQIMGIDLFRYKLVAFFIGCFFAGIAGSLFAHYMRFVNPEQFPLMTSVWFLGMIIVGGMGSTVGAFLGTIFIRLLEFFTMQIGPSLNAFLPASTSMQIQGAAMLIVFGLVIVLFLIFEPRGLAHRWEVLKSTYRLYPFSY